MDKEFNLHKVCTSLISYLEKELGHSNALRISLDVQLPEQVYGDEYGLLDTITRISTFLTHHLSNGLVNIELLKVSQQKGLLLVRVDVRGSDTSVHRKKKELLAITSELTWLDQIPYKIVFSIQADQFMFSFKISFSDVTNHKLKLVRLFENKKVLLAEDNKITALVFSSFLEEWGCSVTQVDNGADALARFRQEIFDVVLMDIYMPRMNGNEAIRLIRRQNLLVPIIALTASSLENDLTESVKAGANDFLLKPISSEQLKKILTRYV